MSKNQETLIQRFWSRVVNSPDKPGFAIPNLAAPPAPVVHIAPAGLGVAVVQPPHPEFVFENWGNLGTKVASIMQFLSDSGFKKGQRAAILSWNCLEWVLADLAIQSLGGVTVAIYPNSGAEQVNYVLKDSGATVIFGEDQSQLSKVDAQSSILKVLLTEPVDPVAGMVSFQGVRKCDPRMQLANVKLSLGGTVEGPFLGVSYEDTATFIYTSGSTGVPKGVVLTHGNFANLCRSITRHGIVMYEHDLYLSYLPLAHVYERVNGMGLALWHGVPVAFCKVEQVGEMLTKVHPTIVVGVPAVWRKMRDKVQAQLDKATGLKAKLIAWAFRQKKGSFGYWLADHLVFSKIRQGLGGRIRLMMSGGAPISPDILHFFDQIGVCLVEGYGLTETSGGLSVNTPDANRIGSVGRVIDCVEVRIVKETESDESGEIWVRGATVFKQYWNLPSETSEALTSDGWFKTGDLGRLDADGYLYITGRKKNLLKTDGGKYVAPEKIEKAFDGDPLIQYIVPVGHGKPYICALVFVNQLAGVELLKSKGITVEAKNAAAVIAANADVNAAIAAAMTQANAKLEHWETVKKFKILAEEASVANGLLTPTLKIRTAEVLKRYAALIEEFYVKRA